MTMMMSLMIAPQPPLDWRRIRLGSREDPQDVRVSTSLLCLRNGKASSGKTSCAQSCAVWRFWACRGRKQSRNLSHL